MSWYVWYSFLIHIFEILSVLGVAFDTLALNTVGHTCYMVYNIGLYGVPSVKEEYHRRHPFGINPVKINDIFFPLQTLVTLSIAIYQCCSYEVSKLYTTQGVVFWKNQEATESCSMALRWEDKSLLMYEDVTLKWMRNLGNFEQSRPKTVFKMGATAPILI